jgi:hypothetical protein
VRGSANWVMEARYPGGYPGEEDPEVIT